MAIVICRLFHQVFHSTRVLISTVCMYLQIWNNHLKTWLCLYDRNEMVFTYYVWEPLAIEHEFCNIFCSYLLGHLFFSLYLSHCCFYLHLIKSIFSKTISIEICITVENQQMGNLSCSIASCQN